MSIQKPLRELTEADLQNLVTEQVRESETLCSLRDPLRLLTSTPHQMPGGNLEIPIGFM
jgi:hypothetical protein